MFRTLSAVLAIRAWSSAPVSLSETTLPAISVAREIRRKDKSVAIIFITSMPEYALQGFSVHASGYLVKPVVYVDLAEEITTARRQIRTRMGSFLTLNNEDGSFRINTTDIIYIDVMNHTLFIHMNDRKIQCYGTLKNLEEQLEKDCFSRCHASYLINMRHIRLVMNDNIQMANGEIIPISKSRKRQFQQDLLNYAEDSI